MNHSVQFLMPEMVLVAGAIITLMAGVFGARRWLSGFLALGSLTVGIWLLTSALGSSGRIFSGMLVNDALGVIMRLFFLAATALAVLLSVAFAWKDDDDAGEYFFFLLVAAVSLMIAACAGNLMMIYLAVETLSVVSYVLAGSLKKDLYATEAGLKYFLFGALSTGLMLYGITLVYGLFGTLDLAGINARLMNTAVHAPTLVLAAVMIFAGLAFKAAIVPFHMWVADVYEGAPWPVAAFFSVAPKALGFALLVRIFFGCPAFMHSGLWGVASVLAMATMTVGNLSAFHQTSVKRLLALSSVGQAGYVLAGLATGLLGLQAAFFYLAIYLFMNMGAFVSAALLSPVQADIEAFKGMARRAPAGALFFSVFLLSLAGLPPLAGFMAKFFVIRAAVEVKDLWLAGFVVMNSVVAFFYYLKVIKAMYFDEPTAQGEVRISLSGYLLLFSCLSGVVLFGLWPGPLLSFLSVIFTG